MSRAPEAEDRSQSQPNMTQSSQVDLLAEETHAGRVWALIILAALIGPAISLNMARTTVVVWAAALVGVIALGAGAMAWSGFEYRFLRHGVEISMLGFHLRSIPRQSIMSYAIEPWAFFRGYGIRGIGKTRAYVWCNKVVHIKTTNGDIFLGHEDPQRIVRDLDMVMGLTG
jgi:hypothetical protein